MPIVERAHQPRSWRGYQATRAQFSAMVDEIKHVVDAEIEDSSVIEIAISDYERPFDSTEEFLANVDEREWIQLDAIDVEVRDPEKGGLRVAVSLGSSGIRLRLTGADRRSRNAIEPDVVEAIKKDVSELKPEVEGRWYVWPWWILAACSIIPFVLGAVVEAQELDKLGPPPNFNVADPNAAILTVIWGLLAFMAPAMIVAIGSTTSEHIADAFPDIEFLPDNGTTAWQAWQRRARRTILGAREVVYVFAALAGIVSVFILLNSSSSSSPSKPTHPGSKATP